MDNAFIQQARRNIDLLMASKKYQEALNLCNAISSRYPDDRDFKKMTITIQDEAEKANESMIDTKLEEMDPLWDQEKYQEILNGIKYLLRYSPNHKKLQNLYKKAQELYTKQITTLKKQFQKEQSEKLERFLENDPEKLINELYTLERTNPGNTDVMAMTKIFREKLVSKRIAEKKDLIYSDKYDVIETFIESLKKIDEKNTEITKLEKLIKQRKVDNFMEQRKEFVYKGENYLGTLIRLKKYAEAIKVAQELLTIDKNDKEVLSLFEKAKDLYFKQTRDQTVLAIEKNSTNLKAEYQASKENFIKI
ncbi:MAG: hypothetical protein WCX95_02250 [Candidatus Gracilibacteria bacterium]